jgi:hypothetical protein
MCTGVAVGSTGMYESSTAHGHSRPCVERRLHASHRSRICASRGTSAMKNDTVGRLCALDWMERQSMDLKDLLKLLGSEIPTCTS